jgi:Fe-S oxidoreductase
LAHAVTFWGFLVLLVTVIESYGQLFKASFAIPAVGHASVIGFAEDAAACLVLLAVCVFSVIRLRSSTKRLSRASRFYGSNATAAWTTLAMIALVVVTLLVYRAAQTNTGDFPYGWWAFASHGLGKVLQPAGVDTNRTIATAFVDLNVLLVMAFLVLVVYSKHLHILVAPLNVAFSRQPTRLGALDKTPDTNVETIAEDTVFGAGRIDHFTRKQLLDLLSCTECGRCQSECPAWQSGKPLSPKFVVMDLRDELLGGGHKTLVPDVIGEEALWACTTCGACVEQCPVDIEHLDAIIDMRRYQVLNESRFPSEATSMLHNIENRGDPWGLGASRRLDWTEGLDFPVPVVQGTIPDDIEYLLWVGCAGALDARARETTRSVARLLHLAGIRFAVLGPRESCTGDPARRFGNEYLFQLKARENIDTLRAVGAHKIVTTCPHCFNSRANEYLSLDGNFELVHHSQLLAKLVADGALQPKQMHTKLTYHDPCYLGRHNHIYDPARSVIDAIPGLELREMGRCREHSFCCGAGGARMWLEESRNERVNLERIDEALGTQVVVIATACPYCLVMLDDAVKDRGREEDISVFDLARLLERAMQAPPGR